MATEKILFGVLFVYTWIMYVGIAVFMDTFFGLWRAIKEKIWNSSFGINGLIRKACMMACVSFMAMMDAIMSFDLITMLPGDASRYMKMIGVEHVGFAGFFGILFVAYEIVSILKNMCLCGLPVKWVWLRVDAFLRKFTDELPDKDELPDGGEADKEK